MIYSTTYLTQIKKQTLVGTAPTVAKRLKKTSGMDVGQILAMCISVNCDFRKTNGVRDPNKHPEKNMKQQIYGAWGQMG